MPTIHLEALFQSGQHPMQKKKDNYLSFAQQQSEKNPCNTLTPPLKKLLIHLKKLPHSSQWKIINDAPLLFSSQAKSSLKTSHVVKHATPSYAAKRKRALFVDLTSDDKLNPQKNKKTKKDSPMYPLGPLWLMARRRIIDQFKQLNIDIDLTHLLSNETSFDERKAIVYNNYAIFLIEDLNNPEKKYSDTGKISALKKAEQLLKKSIRLYKKANLSEKKQALEQCINSIQSTISGLEAKRDETTTPKDSSPMNTQRYRSQSIINFPKEYFFEYQPIFSNRLAYKFFNASLPEDQDKNIKKTSPISI